MRISQKTMERVLSYFNMEDYELIETYENGCRLYRKNEWCYTEAVVEFFCTDLSLINETNYHRMLRVAVLVLKRYK